MFTIQAADKQSIALQCLQIAFIGNKVGQGEGFGTCIEDPPEDILKLRQTASDVLRGFLLQKEEKKEPGRLDQSASSVVFETYLQTRSRGNDSVRYFMDNCGNMLSEMGFMFANNAGVPQGEFFAIIAAEALSRINENMSTGLARLVVNAVREGNASVMLDSLSNHPGNCAGACVAAEAACDVASDIAST